MTIIVGSSPRRIAVLSLQRLGDVLTAARVTDALSRRQDTASVEVIHWDATRQAAALLPGVTRTHALPFTGLRHRSRIHPLAPLHSLKLHVARICDDLGFDEVINLSSTRFAAWLAPALLARGGQILGPYVDDAGHYVAGHPTIEYLNDWGTDPDLNSFAHQDLYASAARVRLSGFAGLARRTKRTHGPIVVHVKGSEPAKNWRTPEDWHALITRLQADHGCRCILTGAPSETAELRALSGTSGAKVATLPLAECMELLNEAAGLVSVDTVAIHMAALVDCPTVVLRQGPARGLAFVPGPRALCVDSHTCVATTQDVAELCAYQFAGDQDALARVAPQVSARQGVVDDLGFLGLAALPHLAPSTENADPLASLWRHGWQRTWRGNPVDESTLAQLLADRTHPKRVAALLASETELGAAARQVAAQGRSAA